MRQLTIKSLEGKLVLAATILASGMAFLDGTIITIAIPVIQSSFNTNLAGIQWVINSYALLLAALILISGSLGDRFGRKRIFSYGITLFVLSSFLCSIAQSIEQLIIFRSIQGIGAAMMIPGSLSIINTAFDDKVHGKAIGLWSGFSGGVAALGPFIGGWLVETFGWPSIFYINIPIGLIALYLTYRYIPETKNDEATQLDVKGTVLLFLGLLGISYALIQAPVSGWSDTTVVSSLVIGLWSIVTFVYHERKVKDPLVPLKIFSSPLVTGANIMTLFLYFALQGVIFFLILNFQQLQHYSPLIAGMGMLPTIILITFLSGPAGALSDRIGPRYPMIIGSFIVAVGMASFILAGKSANYFTAFLPGLLLFGGGMALVIAPLTKSALAVDHRFSGAASGVNNAISRIAALLAIALLGAVMAFFFAGSLEERTTKSALNQAEKHQIIQQKNKIGDITIPQNFSEDTKRIAQEQIDDAFLFSFRNVMAIAASLAFISSLVSFFMIHNRPIADKKKNPR